MGWTDWFVLSVWPAFAADSPPWPPQGRPFLMVGSHKLEGEFSKVTKKMAILEKAEGGSLRVRAMVQSKAVFRKRPKPIVRRKGLSSIK